MNRRSFLGSSIASGGLLAAGGLLAPRAARAATGADRKFLFVYNLGGWDPTRVFAPEYANPAVAMEATSSEATAGGLSFVDHPNRPSVRAFFEAFHGQSAILNGMLVRAISHDLCRMIALTGSTSGFAPDWPAIIAAGAADRYVLPHLVIAGPSYPGDYVSFVARTGLNGQLDGLLSGNILEVADLPANRPGRGVAASMDAFLAARAEARLAAAAAGPDAALAEAYQIATARSAALKALRDSMEFDAGEDLDEQATLAVRALSTGLSRCVSLAWPAGGQEGTWDTHTENDMTQSMLFEDLFAGLVDLAERLRTTEGTSGGSLLDETTVVVWSEMGRTPNLNDTAGKDHWPYTSLLLFGAGVTGDRVIGGWDENYAGVDVDPDTGEIADSGTPLSAEMVGATLLAAADIDPAEHVAGVDPLGGVLS